MSRLRLVDAARVLALLAMSPAAYGATVVFGESFKSVPLAAIMFTLVLSTLAGVVALLNRIRDELRTSGTLRYPGIFIASHMSGSWLAGALMFIIGLGMGWPDWTVAGGIIGASFLGAVFIERVAVKWISQKLGVDITKPVPLDPPLQRYDVAPPPAIHVQTRPVPALPTPTPWPPPPVRTRTRNHTARREPDPSDFTPFDDDG